MQYTGRDIRRNMSPELLRTKRSLQKGVLVFSRVSPTDSYDCNFGFTAVPAPVNTFISL